MPYDLDIDEIKNFLSTSILFQGADDNGLELIANHLERVRFKKGEPIVLENEVSDHVYFVYSGSAEVVKHVAEINQMARLATLKKGSQFSEFSVLNRARKGASVFALEDCEVLRMSGEVFINVLSQLPAVAQSLAVHIAKMSRHVQTSNVHLQYVNADMVRFDPKILQIMPPQVWKKLKALPLSLDGHGLSVAVRDHENRELYEYVASQHPKIRIKIYLINEEDFLSLGDQLLSGYKAGSLAPGPGAVASVPVESAALRGALSGDPLKWMPKISLFNEMPHEWISEIAKHFEEKTFAENEIIYDSGAMSEHMYFVLSGAVDVAMPLPLNAGNAEIHIGELQPGDYFSEVSLLTQSPHILSARAKSPVRLASLNKSVVEHLMQSPAFSLPLARDLAIQFQSNTSGARFHFFDPQSSVQVKELAHLIPKSILAQYEIMPLQLKNDELTVGITNPESETIYSIISRYLHDYRVKMELIKQKDFQKWLAEVNGVVDGAPTVVGRSGSANLVKSDPVKSLDDILAYGYDNRASDIHIEPQSDCYVIRYRIDGVLQEHSEKYSTQLGSEIVSRIKILSKMDVTNRMTPQDGQLNIDQAGRPLYARTSTLPAKRGEKVVLRLIRQRNSVPPLPTLVPDRRVINILREVVASQQGVFLVTGPTGSGKSTTLYSLLEELNRVESNIVSLEDPVELEVTGTTQVEMDEKTGLTFAKALRSALRQDPDVIMVGEIRDEESAKIAFHAAATGHLVISTLHTNDSLSVIPRLFELGISKQAMGATLLGASAQRLVRKVCDQCQFARPITRAEVEVLKMELPQFTPPDEVYQGRGCSHCHNTGYYGRIPIMEVWKKNKVIEAALLDGGDLEKFFSAVTAEPGYMTLRQFALKMACSGLTTFDEVEGRFSSFIPDLKVA